MLTMQPVLSEDYSTGTKGLDWPSGPDVLIRSDDVER